MVSSFCQNVILKLPRLIKKLSKPISEKKIDAMNIIIIEEWRDAMLTLSLRLTLKCNVFVRGHILCQFPVRQIKNVKGM